MKKSAFLILALFLSIPCLRAQNHASAAQSARLSLPAAPTDGSAIAKDSYVIAPSDTLTVTVWGQPSLSGALLVRPDGKISMPLLADIQASGLTPMQLSARITAKLTSFVKDPQVSVVVVAIHKNFVYLLGEVGKKGPVELTSGMTLLEAISSAGGLTDFANKKKIYVLRTLNGKQERLPVKYKDALKGDAGCNLLLAPGDTIVVP